MKRLTHREESIMQIFWKLGKAFIKDVMQELEEPKPPVTTVSSIVRKLEANGYLAHEAFGKTHRYYALIKKEEYRKFSLEKFVDNYFGGSAEQLLSYFVKEEKINPEDLDALLENLKDK